MCETHFRNIGAKVRKQLYFSVFDCVEEDDDDGKRL